jgi:ABC-type nitrate/sulfonate/bicarbonate transport system substrate-binding protein
MRDLRTPLAAAIGISLCLGAMPVDAQQAALKMTLFGQPSVNNDSIWMAFEKGLYQQEGLDVTYRLFPSGTTAFQAFQTGQGDIVMTGDLPSVQYFFRAKGDYRTIAAIERDAKGYVAVARKEITKPQDLVGKTVATRVGSTGSWFISEYLTKNGVDPSKVTVKNLDTQVLPAALCGGDIAAFFIWQPVGSRTLEIFLMVIIPSAVPYIVTGMRVAMASSFMSIIPAEILAADSGIGYLLQKSSLLLQTNRIFVALLTICLLGFVVDRIFRFLVERVLTRYMSYVSVT